jgi:hypothetical protein
LGSDGTSRSTGEDEGAKDVDDDRTCRGVEDGKNEADSEGITEADIDVDVDVVTCDKGEDNTVTE